MKVSTEISSASKLVGEEKAIELVAKAGFDAWDFSMFSMCKYDWNTRKLLENNHPLSKPDYLCFAKKLKKVADDNGIICNQSHAPFPLSCKDIRSYMKRAIECTAVVGGDVCVIHPDNDKSVKKNAKMFVELLDFAKDHGVRIATENMWNWDNKKDISSFAACSTSSSFVEHIDAVNDISFVACLDIGHAEMKGSGDGAANMIRALGHRLQALHIHDNDRHHDSHQIPFSMKIDFVPIVKALKDIGYSGYFTLEAGSYLNSFTADNCYTAIKDLYIAVRRLADMYEAL